MYFSMNNVILSTNIIYNQIIYQNGDGVIPREALHALTNVLPTDSKKNKFL